MVSEGPYRISAPTIPEPSKTIYTVGKREDHCQFCGNIFYNGAFSSFSTLPCQPEAPIRLESFLFFWRRRYCGIILPHLHVRCEECGGGFIEFIGKLEIKECYR